MIFFSAVVLCLALCCRSPRSGSESWALLERTTGIFFYFTRPEPDAGRAAREKARAVLLEKIEEAKESLEVWVYGLNDAETIRALVRAGERGVSVTLTGSPDQDYSSARAAGLAVRVRGESGLMHIKAVLVDRSLLFAGTGNFTRSGFFFNHNSFFTLPLTRPQAAALANALYHEHESGALVVGGARLLISPANGRRIQAEIVRAILSAKRSIRYLIYSYSDPVIARALLTAASRGVLVEGIHDDFQDDGRTEKNSRLEEMNAAAGNLPILLYREGNRSIYRDENGVDHGGKLHHKTMIIDEERVYTGSYNWSLSARDSNREVFAEFRGVPIALAFIGEFERIRERSVLLERPPLVQVSGRMYYKPEGGGRLCWTEEIPRRGITAFSGVGPYFRAAYFRPDVPAKSGCLAWKDREKSSAGIASMKSFLLPPARTPEGDIAAYAFNGRPVRNEHVAENYPCENPASCGIMEAIRFDPGEGRLWLRESERNLKQIRIWDRRGMGSWLSLRETEPGYYVFEKQIGFSGDALYFTRDRTNRERLGCLQGGKTLDRTLVYFLDFFGEDAGERPACSGINPRLPGPLGVP